MYYLFFYFGCTIIITKSDIGLIVASISLGFLIYQVYTSKKPSFKIIIQRNAIKESTQQADYLVVPLYIINDGNTPILVEQITGEYRHTLVSENCQGSDPDRIINAGESQYLRYYVEKSKYKEIRLTLHYFEDKKKRTDWFTLE